MDYEKKYKEALERAKRFKEDPQSVFYEFTPKEGQGIEDYIFPELEESEDEKVRKEIIDYCHERLNTTYGALPNIETIKRWLAWLEKQGEKEQKFNSIVQIPDGCHAYIKDRKVYIENHTKK